MNRLLTLLLTLLAVFPTRAQEVRPGAADTAAYLPLLAGQRVAVLCNHTARVGDEHLIDLLCRCGVRITAIFSPEHGFRGSADAGEQVRNGVDEATGIPIRSLYDGHTKRPSAEAMHSFDVLVADMQDVGVRFYTYHIALLRMMDACAEEGKRVIVLDRPNPNGHTVDGPLLDERFRSGVGAIPVPVLHGLTMGEIARMAVGEGWTKRCDLKVVVCRDYDRHAPYALPVAPSPNLPTQHAVALYPSVCLFEGTVLSVGRGTPRPFEVFGHPDLKGKGYDYTFTPQSVPGAKHPPFEGRTCYGSDLGSVPDSLVRSRGLDLGYLVEAYRASGMGDGFFTPLFEKLIGTDYVRRMIEAGAPADSIRARWQPDVERFRALRRPYLIYGE